MESYLDDGHPFPERMHLSVLFATFQMEMFELIRRWAEFAADEIDEWPTTSGLGETERVIEMIDAMVARRSVLAEAPPELGDADNL